MGDDGLHGVGGPLHVSTNKFRSPLAKRTIKAGEQMGLLRHENNLNREDREGVGYCWCNIKNGNRQSAAVAFLDPVRHRRNLRIVTHVMVDRIRFDGRRAVGVECCINGKPSMFGSRSGCPFFMADRFGAVTANA